MTPSIYITFQYLLQSYNYFDYGWKGEKGWGQDSFNTCCSLTTTSTANLEEESGVDSQFQYLLQSYNYFDGKTTTMKQLLPQMFQYLLQSYNYFDISRVAGGDPHYRFNTCCSLTTTSTASKLWNVAKYYTVSIPVAV